VEEAIGIAEAAKKENMPVAISFTVETDGRLPTRESLKSAILEVEKRTRQYPVYYMIDCAHATHFADELSHHEPWGERLCGIRAHASQKSRAELKELAAPDAGNPKEFGMEYATLKQHIKHLNVLGGCCGTDHRHIEQIALWCSELFP